MKLAGPLNVLPIFYTTFVDCMDWLFPPPAAAADRPGRALVRRLPAGRTDSRPVCPCCGEPKQPAGLPAVPGFHPCLQPCARSGIFSGPLRKALHRLKYKSDIGMGELFPNT
jgi:hypothetical protein